MLKTSKITNAILGVAIGDAVGVPYEFSTRAQMQHKPARGLIGYGTHNQPPGTWSDDTSLTLCLAESLINGYDLIDISKRFLKWKNDAYWTARGEVFDIGLTTAEAIKRLERIVDDNDRKELISLKYSADECDNGNGSLMRIVPLLAYVLSKPIKEQFEVIWNVSAFTHRHIRSSMSCLIYLKLLEGLYLGENKERAYEKSRKTVAQFWDQMSFAKSERAHFGNVIQRDVRVLQSSELKSGGYVIEVLESSINQFLTCHSYEETVLSMINLGHDTDTSAAIAGGLAGMYYGLEGIPEYWLVSIARMEDIIAVGNKLGEKYSLE